MSETIEIPEDFDIRDFVKVDKSRIKGYYGEVTIEAIKKNGEVVNFGKKDPSWIYPDEESLGIAVAYLMVDYEEYYFNDQYRSLIPLELRMVPWKG